MTLRFQWPWTAPLVRLQNAVDDQAVLTVAGFANIGELLVNINRNVRNLMTDISGLSQSVTDLTAQVAANGASIDQAVSSLDELAALVASLEAGTVTQGELDDLQTQIVAAKDALAASGTGLDTAVQTDDPTPPVAP